MLVLSRKVGERVLLDVPGRPPIWVTVVSNQSGKVRLGFDADRTVGIWREELLPDAPSREGTR